MAVNIPLVLTTALDEYALPLIGDHGVADWARVRENGQRLAEETGANVEVVQLFAVLPDSRRRHEVSDPQHGPRERGDLWYRTGTRACFAELTRWPAMIWYWKQPKLTYINTPTLC